MMLRDEHFMRPAVGDPFTHNSSEPHPIKLKITKIRGATFIKIIINYTSHCQERVSYKEEQALMHCERTSTYRYHHNIFFHNEREVLRGIEPVTLN